MGTGEGFGGLPDQLPGGRVAESNGLFSFAAENPGPVSVLAGCRKVLAGFGEHPSGSFMRCRN